MDALAPDPQVSECSTQALELPAPPRLDQVMLSRFTQCKPPARDDGDLTNDVAKRIIEAERDGSAEGLTWASYDR